MRDTIASCGTPVRLLGLTLLALGCGGAPRAARPTPETSGSGTATSASADAASGASTSASAEPCSTWDPAADPTVAPADVAGPPPGARDGGDGLRFCILRRGTGRVRPSRADRVRVHYTGWTTDGRMFDSSRARGEPASFPVTGVIRGWVDTLTHMTVGQVRRVWIPEELAYRGAEGSPAGMLVFDIELVAIEGAAE
ncbi:MAG: hypothetical protein OHK0013_08560 [Sandaracinaceae bacterium]